MAVWTSSVRRYPEGASPYGVLEMAGNVYEWTMGWYNSDNTMRAARGGYWASGAEYVRTTYRKNYYPQASSPALGFRPLKSLH